MDPSTGDIAEKLIEEVKYLPQIMAEIKVMS